MSYQEMGPMKPHDIPDLCFPPHKSLSETPNTFASLE